MPHVIAFFPRAYNTGYNLIVLGFAFGLCSRNLLRTLIAQLDKPQASYSHLLLTNVKYVFGIWNVQRTKTKRQIWCFRLRINTFIRTELNKGSPDLRDCQVLSGNAISRLRNWLNLIIRTFTQNVLQLLIRPFWLSCPLACKWPTEIWTL